MPSIVSKREKAQQLFNAQIKRQESSSSERVLNRLSSGARARISTEEMKQRSKRLYNKLPEVVARKQEEEVKAQRLERLKKIRQDGKVLHILCL